MRRKTSIHRPLLAELAFTALAIPIAATASPPSATAGGAAPDATSRPQAETPATHEAAEEVIVTARHRSERAQNVPIALTAVTARQLSNNGITQLNQLGQLAPTLQVTAINPRNTSFNIRGIGNNISISNDGLESGVGVYVDGVLYARPAQANFAFPDVEAIEVLRGPQGTLFGKNTTAGAINVTTRLPSFTYGTDSEATLGNYGFWQLKSGVTAPVNDRIAIRVSFLGDAHDGSVTNIDTRQHYQTQDDKALRAQLLFLATDRLTIRLIGDYAHSQANCCVSLPTGIFTTLQNGKTLANNFATRAARLDYTLPGTDPFERNTDINSPQRFTMETGGVSLHADYDLNGFVLSSISAWRFWNWDPVNDVDATGLDVFAAANQTDYQRQVSQELRVTSPSGRRIDYTAGLYYFYQDIPGTNRTLYGNDAGSFILGGNLPLALASTALRNLTIGDKTDAITSSYASYGQGTWHVLPRLDLTGGLRFTYEDKSGSFGQQQFGGAALDALPGPLLATVRTLRNSVGQNLYYHDQTHNAALSWLATATYRLAPSAIAYATYSRGSKSGGVNVSSLPAGIDPVVKPERLDNYELGLKSQLFQRRLTVDLAAYWIEDADYQGTIIAPLSANSFATYISNVPKVRSRGFEIDASTSRFHGALLRFSGAFDDAIYASFPSGPCPVEQVGGGTAICNLSGKPVPGQSRWAMSVGGEYEHALRPAWGIVLYAGADFGLRSSYYASANDSIYSKIPGYGTLDVRAGARTEDGRYDLFLWSHNATDTKYFTNLTAGLPTSGLVVGIPGDPLAFGATLRVHI